MITKLIISGSSGHMGRCVAALASDDPQITIVAGFDIAAGNPSGFPVYSSPSEFSGDADVVVDFSSPAALSGLLKFGISAKVPLVLCATGYSPEQINDIKDASGRVPILHSGNMSLGINLLADLVRRACAVLGQSYDVEIVERHHRRKVDAPSGTALLLANAAAAALPYESELVFERQSTRRARGPHEIGVSAVRGGTIAGQHDVIFAGQDEVIELKHSAASPEVFAVGAIRAAKYLSNIEKPGLYNMSDVLDAKN